MNLYRELLGVLEEGKRVAMVTVIACGGYDNDLVGQKVLVAETGEVIGQMGEAALQEALVAGGREGMAVQETMIATYPPGLTTVPSDTESGPWIRFFVEPIMPEPEVLILGAGHIARPLAVMAGMVGFRVLVADDRPDFANTVHFPTASKVLCAPFAELLRNRQAHAATFVVIVTRGHRYDYECLRWAVDTGAGYIGMIGSRRRVRLQLERLREEGVDAEAIDRVYTPIGLNIGAQTPEEIAVSILAELIGVRRGGTAASMKIAR